MQAPATSDGTVIAAPRVTNAFVPTIPIGIAMTGVPAHAVAVPLLTVPVVGEAVYVAEPTAVITVVAPLPQVLVAVAATVAVPPLLKVTMQVVPVAPVPVMPLV